MKTKIPKGHYNSHCRFSPEEYIAFSQALSPLRQAMYLEYRRQFQREFIPSSELRDTIPDSKSVVPKGTSIH